MDKRQCICCHNWLDTELLDSDPLTIGPVYDGLVFRTTGNFGSRIFDPMPIGVEEYLQVIICDGCIKKNAKQVIRIHNVRRMTTSDIEVPFDSKGDDEVMTQEIVERLLQIRAEHKADVDKAVADPVFCTKVMTFPEYNNAHSSRAYLLTHIARLEAEAKITGEELVSMTDSREKLRGLLSRCEDQCSRLMDRPE